MGKAPKKQPAIHMMVGDYFKDPLLGQASLISRGVWYEILMFMWEGDRRGEIITTPIRLMGLVRCRDINEILHFFNEIIDIEFGYVKFHKEIKNPVSLENCNTKVTLRNRRMYSEFKDRQNTRLRVQKHREKKTETEKKRKSNSKITPSLSVSSSITYKKKEIIKKEKVYPDWLDKKLWLEYKQHRKEKKSKMTELAETKAINKLKRLIDAGNDQEEVIEQTIAYGWKGLFKVDTNKNIKPKTYAQAQDAERRQRAKWLKGELSDNQKDSGDRTDKAIPLLPSDSV